MFFPKLRRRAKWVFLLLAIVFAGGFVFFGVGTGGSGIGDYVSDLLGRQPQTGGLPSVEEAQKKVEEEPGNAAAQLELANALQAEGRTAEAIAALRKYTELRPKDVEALQQLAALYDLQALKARERAQAAEAESSGTAFGQELQTPDSPLSQTLFSSPIASAVQEKTSERSNAAFTEMQRAYREEAAVYQKLALLTPRDPNVFIQLGQASYFAGDTQSAIAAWEQFLELAPNDPNADLVRQQLKVLKSLGGTVGTP